jgi:CelD/BcsL family acetyltransferase involved in cellulose biosynthesis
MIRLKRSKFVETNGYDRFDADRCYREYYVQATERLFNTKSIHLSALKLDEQILAANWGFVFAGRFYGLMAGYDRTWKRYAPGRLLSEYLIRWAAEEGLALLDFGVGDEPYKLSYCDVHWPLSDAMLPAKLKGQAFAWALNLKRFTSSALRATRPSAH